MHYECRWTKSHLVPQGRENALAIHTIHICSDVQCKSISEAFISSCSNKANCQGQILLSKTVMSQSGLEIQHCMKKGPRFSDLFYFISHPFASPLLFSPDPKLRSCQFSRNGFINKMPFFMVQNHLKGTHQLTNLSIKLKKGNKWVLQQKKEIPLFTPSFFL